MEIINLASFDFDDAKIKEKLILNETAMETRLYLKLEDEL